MKFISEHKTRTIVAVCITVLAGSAFGYWGYTEYQVYELRNELTKLMTDTSLRLRDALSVEPGSKAADSPQILRKLYDNAVAVDGHYRELHNTDFSPVGELVDAADDYVLTAREILLRRASSQRNHQKLAASLQALRDHMRADNRTGAWVTAAVRAKERVEEDYRDYRTTTEALGALLETFPASQAKIIPHVETALLIDDSLVNEVHQKIRDASTRTASEVEKLASLKAYR